MKHRRAKSRQQLADAVVTKLLQPTPIRLCHDPNRKVASPPPCVEFRTVLQRPSPSPHKPTFYTLRKTEVQAIISYIRAVADPPFVASGSVYASKQQVTPMFSQTISLCSLSFHAEATYGLKNCLTLSGSRNASVPPAAVVENAPARLP